MPKKPRRIPGVKTVRIRGRVVALTDSQARDLLKRLEKKAK